MTKFLILHGTDATPQDNWFMWLKGRLIGLGHEVWLPQLPHADKPNSETYNKYLLTNKKFTIDSETVLIGHSSGAVEILSLLGELPDNIVIKGAVLVSAFKDDLKWDALEGLFQKSFDFDVIKAHCDQFVFIHSDNDPYAPLVQAEYLSHKLDSDLVIIEGQGHFNIEASPDYVQFPELLEIIKSIA